MKQVLMFLVAGMACWVNAATPVSMLEWRSVQTNEIVRWKTLNRAPDGLVVDPASRSVRFLVEATGANSYPIEFLVCGPLTDHPYEALFVSVASPTKLAAAFEQIGMPRGKGVDLRMSQSWPQGDKLRLTVAPWVTGTAKCPQTAATNGLDTVLKDTRVKTDGNLLDRPVAYTAGTRDANGALLAETNMPCAIFALYSHGPSIFQFDGKYDQSEIYGRFVGMPHLKLGALYELTATWDGVKRVKEFELTLTPSNVVEQIGILRSAVKQQLDVFAKIEFAPSVTVEQAMNIAQGFAMLDGTEIKMNGMAAGQFFYRSFLPDNSWRTRAQRPFQPFEVHVAADGAKTMIFVEEDWSGDGLDPVLKPKSTPFKEWSELPGLIAKVGPESAKISVLLIYAPKTMRVEELTPILAATMPRISTFYIFGE